MGFLCAGESARKRTVSERASDFRLRMDEDAPFQARVSVPIRPALAGVPSRWINQMSVHHVYLQRVCRAAECTAGIGAFVMAGSIPVRLGCATRSERVATGS